jgi:uncharacterized protein
MKIVVDTNVLISGVFFGGYPRKIIEAIIDEQLRACATSEIIGEYEEIVVEMINRKQGHIRKGILLPLIAKLEVIHPRTAISVCRDPDDDKFLSCAVDAKALYIVSGDKDLLSIGEYEDVKIITAAEFCNCYLSDINE